MPGVERTRLQQWTFLRCSCSPPYAFWRTLEPIWVPVLLGLVIAVGVHPIHERLLPTPGRKTSGLTAAVLTGVLMVLALRSRVLVFVVGQRVLESPDSWPRATRRRRRGTPGPRPQRPALAARGPTRGDQSAHAEAARDLAAFLGKARPASSRAVHRDLHLHLHRHHLLLPAAGRHRGHVLAGE